MLTRPDPEAPGLAARLAAVLATTATRFGIRDDPAAIRPELLALFDEPVGLFEDHAVWPSRLTGSGLPLELSLKLDGSGAASVRCVADVTDHRRDPEENWRRYLRWGELVAGGNGAGPGEVWRLCRAGLSGAPAAYASRMMHGVGYAGGDRSRGSLYFRTGWLEPESLARRFPMEAAAVVTAGHAYGCRLATRIEVAGYDFTAGAAVRRKVYLWPAVALPAPFTEVAGRHPALEPARELFETFIDGVPPTEHGLLLQLALDDDPPRPRLFFPSESWGWTDEHQLDRLFEVLVKRFDIDPSPLSTMATAASGLNVELVLAMVAVGTDAYGPSATFYLWPGDGEGAPAARPAPVHAAPPAPRPGLAQRLLDRAGCYLGGRRALDGSWSEEEHVPGLGPVCTTALVVSYLAGGRSPLDLQPSLDWMAAQVVQGEKQAGPSATESLAMTVEALAGAGWDVDETARAALTGAQAADGSFGGSGAEEAGPAEVTAACLSALLSAFPGQVGAILPAVLRLVAQQREDGAWDVSGWAPGLVSTARAVRALDAYVASPVAAMPFGEGSRQAAVGALRRARRHLGATALPPEPWWLAHWLAAWMAAGGDPCSPATTAALDALARTQGAEGGWRGGLSRRLADIATAQPGPELHADSGLVTTAAVAGALQRLLVASAAEP